MELKQRKKQYKLLSKGGWTPEGRAFQVEKFKTLFPGKFVINQVSPVNFDDHEGHR